MMKQLVMVCHTETWCKTGGWEGFEEVMAGYRRAWRVAERRGKRPRVTLCLTTEAVEDHRDVFAALRDEGHEIGVHSHLPGAQRGGHSYSGGFAYRIDEAGRLNQDLAAAGIRQRIVEAGLGTATAHVSGMFTFRDTTASVLEESGLRVDCSLYPGDLSTHEATGDFVLCDNRGRTCPAAYRLSRADHCQPGDSAVVELPVWGHLNAGDDQECLLEIARESNRSGEPMAARWEAYWRERGALADVAPSGSHVAGRPEAVQLFLHYWNFIDDRGRAIGQDLERLGRFLSAWAELEGCDFATATEAADTWAGADG